MKLKIFLIKKKKKLNHDSFFIKRNNNSNLKSYNQRFNKSELKSSNINRIINDGFVIDKYIKSNRLKTRKTPKKTDKERILLKLEKRLKAINNKKRKEYKKKNDNLTDEEIFSKKLSLVPGFAKKFFRDIYNRILFENRVLSKKEEYNIKSAMEKLMRRKKLITELKRDTIQRMRIARDNLVTEQDDKNLIGEQKKAFDFYGNLDGLEWLIMKKNILYYGKKFH